MQTNIILLKAYCSCKYGENSLYFPHLLRTRVAGAMCCDFKQHLPQHSTSMASLIASDQNVLDRELVYQKNVHNAGILKASIKSRKVLRLQDATSQQIYHARSRKQWCDRGSKGCEDFIRNLCTQDVHHLSSM